LIGGRPARNGPPDSAHMGKNPTLSIINSITSNYLYEFSEAEMDGKEPDGAK
jgi:hypothetical protein